MKILLFGKDGQVGWELRRALAPLGEIVLAGRLQADLDQPHLLRSFLRQVRPEVIVNAAAYTEVDKAESEPEKARRINAQSVGVMAEEAARLNAWLVHYSTDYVFDGEKSSPYREEDPTNPLSVYGKTKLEGERLIQELNARHMIFRTSWVYSVHGRNFAKTMLRLAKEEEELKVVMDQQGAPTSAELIADVTAHAIYRLFTNTPKAQMLAGMYHLAANGETTWHGYAQYLLELAHAKGSFLKAGPDAVRSIPASAYALPAVRPANSRLDTTKLVKTFNLHLPDWRYHVQRLVDELFAKEAG